MGNIAKWVIAIAMFLMTANISLLAGQQESDEEIQLPKVSAVVVLQGTAFFNGDSTYFAGSEKPADNGFDIRDAMIVVDGQYRDHLEYNLEVGSALCLDGGFMVMEAGVLYKFFPYLKAGFTKGHVLRGFEMHQECIELLSAEKPLFAKKFSPCHPLGAIIEYERDFENGTGCLVQLVMAEGSGGTLEDEYDINIGAQYRTPVEGLSFAGSFTLWRWNSSYSVKDSVHDPNGGRDDFLYSWIPKTMIYDGYRASFGFDYNANNFLIRGEGYIGKGFKDLLDIPYYSAIWKDSSNMAKVTKAPFEDLKMRAFYIQAGYSISLKNDNIKYVRPYVQYQWWNQAADLDGDYTSSYLTVGVDFGIGPGYTRIKFDYQTCLVYAEDGALPGYDEEFQADRLMMRLQFGVD
nr:hypothetical protein [candidate division Zixibacteria bacterium]